MRRSIALSFLLLAVSTAGCMQDAGADGEDSGSSGLFAKPDPDAATLALLQDLATFPEWRMETDHGTIRMILYTGWLPTTTGHMIQLTDRGFYDGTIVHRVVDDFVIQGGDPTETGEGGSGPYGTSDDIPLEISEDPVLDFGTGAVGLARWTDDTGDSQYFITEKPAIHLSRPDENGTGAVFGAYSLFAQVFEGQDVVRDIADVPTDPNDRPDEDVLLHNATIRAPPSDVDLLGLIPEVVPDVATQGYAGTFEHPRILVTDHPATLRFTTDHPEPETDPTSTEAPEPVPCTIHDFGLWVPGAEGPAYRSWERDDVDTCTFEHTLTFDAPGTYTVDLGIHEVSFQVLPWHDAYAPYTGTPKADT